MKKVHLAQEQRYTISAVYKQGCSQKMIAQAIEKDKSVICRELKRNANTKGKYTFAYAQDMAEMRKERTKLPRKLTSPTKETNHWTFRAAMVASANSIEDSSFDAKPIVSHETIYKMILEDKKAGGNLYVHARHKLKYRKRHQAKHIPIKNRLSIEQCLDIVNLKQRFGDWEMDVIVG